MPEDASPKRPKPISWRPPTEKRAAFEARVAESGLSTNAFITEAVFGRSRHRPAELQHLARIHAECAAMADALRRIAAERGEEAASEAHLAALIEIRSALMLLMGRRP